ncbi:hypothetical protein DCCM_2040 [Desulfocucumis palustris]|uniref:Uncharacterized protein n=1 Tax=Desulfocucumis palustris TaxID=1898651 RepID=A0A2L2XB91_9FIRM|nr:hypothetical protein DCCM_2040 [Desulfocucumis palustris]
MHLSSSILTIDLLFIDILFTSGFLFAVNYNPLVISYL